MHLIRMGNDKMEREARMANLFLELLRGILLV